MAFSLVGNAQAGGSGTSASVTHGLTISDGDLVVFYVNSNSNSVSPSADAGGASWATEFVDAPSGETARQAMTWKVAGASEPSSYSWTVGNADWRVIVKVFSRTGGTPQVDSAAVAAITGGTSENIVCSASNGVTISDNAVSVVFGGMDNRFDGGTYDSADNSYVSPFGGSSNQACASAHRIFTTGGTGATVTITDSSTVITDLTYSIHISFVEAAAGGGATLISSIIQNYRNMGYLN